MFNKQGKHNMGIRNIFKKSEVYIQCWGIFESSIKTTVYLNECRVLAYTLNFGELGSYPRLKYIYKN